MGDEIPMNNPHSSSREERLKAIEDRLNDLYTRCDNPWLDRVHNKNLKAVYDLLLSITIELRILGSVQDA